MRHGASLDNATPASVATRLAHLTSSRMLNDPLGDQSVDGAVRTRLSRAPARSTVSP